MSGQQDDGTHVGITVLDVYQQLVRLQTTVDLGFAKQDQHGLTLADHEARLRIIERNRWPLASVTALVALASLVVAILVALYGN